MAKIQFPHPDGPSPLDGALLLLFDLNLSKPLDNLRASCALVVDDFWSAFGRIFIHLEQVVSWLFPAGGLFLS